MQAADFFRSDSHVVVIGDVMLDRYYEGSVDRISPEAPVPILHVADCFERPGGAANVALNLASLGVQVTLVGLVGKDADAARLETLLGEGGVACRFIVSQTARTIVKVRALSRRQQVLRLDFEDSFANEPHDALAAVVASLLPAASLIILSDYGKGSLTEAAALITASRAAGVPVLVDPKGLDFSKYAGATLITPNLSEFTAVAGVPADEADFAARAQAMRAELGLDHLLVTRGEQGMTLCSGAGEPYSVAADAREVYDVTGAGDTVIATLAGALASGVPVRRAVDLANVAAGLVVARKGTASVQAADILARMREQAASVEDDPIAAIAAAQRAGEVIVMTNGCFDILHAGHVAYLQQARQMGQRLVVAVNSDASVRRLKGAGRPINPIEDRMAVLSALRCVDWVLAFDGSAAPDGGREDTPRDLIAQVAPDILVKGGDYSVATIVGADAVLARGGRVEVLPLLPGRSTSHIAQRAAQATEAAS